MPKSPPYSPEFRREAVQLLRSSGRSIPQLAKELGVSPQTLRNWASQRDVDEGKAEGLSSAERDELRRLRREVKVLAEEREILKRGLSASLPLPRGRRRDAAAARPWSTRPTHRTGSRIVPCGLRWPISPDRGAPGQALTDVAAPVQGERSG